MVFWVLLALLAFTFVVSPLLAPKQKGPAANLGDIKPPTAEKGTPVPVVFGTWKVSPNVVWYGNVHAEDVRTVTGNRTLANPFAVNHSTVTGHKYGADIAGVLCHGPIDELMDLQFGDTSMRKYNADNTNYVMGPGGIPVLTLPMTPAFPQVPPGTDNPTVYTINAPDLFGGDSANGGVVGKVDFFFGKLTQVASATLAAKVGEAVSRYKGIVHFVMYNATYGTSPYIQPFYAIVRRCPQVVSPDAATANINGSANPADAIYETMTNARWGLGKSAAAFNVASFTAAAVTLKAEAMGIDIALDAQDSAENMIGEILRHIDGVLFSNPITGLIELKLARADYDPLTVPLVNSSNCTKFENFKRTTWPETINEVKVNYMYRGSLPAYTFVQDTQQAQNLASMQAMGDIASTTMDFKMFSTPDLALKAAFRTLRVVSAPLASGTLTVNRKLASLTVGAVFRLDWAPLGISGMIMRVMNMKLGALDSNTIDLTVTEDVFSTAPAVFTAPPATAWVPPSTTPLVHLRAAAFPAPYFLTKADQFQGMNAVVRSTGASTRWDGLYNDVPTTPDSPAVGTIVTTDSAFCPAGSLVNIYPYTSAYQDEAGFLVQDLNGDMAAMVGTDAAGLSRGDLIARIDGPDGGEWIAWRDIVPQATPNQYLIKGVLRGQFGTVPLNHKAGDIIYFLWPTGFAPYFPGAATLSTPPAASAQTAAGAGYKFWPQVKGITSSLPPEPPTGVIAHPVANTPSLDPQCAAYPLPVGNLALNAIKNNVLDPAALLPDSNNLTWVSRNRLTQTTTVVYDAAGATLEAGETYEIEIRHVSRTTGADIFGILRTVIAAVSPYNYTNVMFEQDIKTLNGGVKVPDADARRTGGGIRFKVRSVRGLLKSYDATLPGFNRDQTAGYPLIPSER
jgi:hypothetical protein